MSMVFKFQKFEDLHVALKNKRSFSFFKSVVKKSYSRYFFKHKEEIISILNIAFSMLENSYNEKSLENNILYIIQNLFRKNDKLFWFHTEYDYYKKSIKPKCEVKAIKKYIKGNNVFDFGAGKGLFALELKKNKYNVFLTDVLDYRSKETLSLPFIKMLTPGDIPQFKNVTMTTTLINDVLHHIRSSYLVHILKSLNKISERLIIKEDVYYVKQHFSFIKKYDVNLSKNTDLKKFSELTQSEQYYFLVLMDFFGNIIAQGITDMNLAYEFKTVHEWLHLFHECGFENKKIIFHGFEDYKLHRNCQIWFICDSRRKEN